MRWLLSGLILCAMLYCFSAFTFHVIVEGKVKAEKDLFEAIKICTYKHFIEKGEIPNTIDYLPFNLRKLVNVGSGVEWRPKDQTFVFTFSRKRPVNSDLLYILTFHKSLAGIVTDTEYFSPDIVKNNAPLYHKAGLLSGSRTVR